MFKSIPVTVGAFIETAVRILKKRQNLDEIEDILQAVGNSSIEEDEKESESSSRTEGNFQQSRDVIELEENAEEANAYKVNTVEMMAEEVNEGETKQGENADETYEEEVHVALNEEEILDKLKKEYCQKKKRKRRSQT